MKTKTMTKTMAKAKTRMQAQTKAVAKNPKTRCGSERGSCRGGRSLFRNSTVVVLREGIMSDYAF